MSTAGSEVAGSTSTATSEQHRQARETLGLSDKRENFSDLTFLSKFRTNPVAALYEVNDPEKDPFYTQIDYLKYPKEAPLHTLATQLKYDKSRGVNYNVEVLASAIQHPYGEVLLRSPSYCDFRFFYETKSQSSYSDALYNALNEFEEFVAMHIIKRVKMLLDKSKSKALIELREKYKEIAYKILAFIRVAPNEINLTELIREAFPNDTSVLKCSVITPDHKQSTQADEERADVFSKYDGWAFYDEQHISNPPIDYRKFQELAKQMLVSVDHSSESAPEESKTPKHIFDLRSKDKYNGFPIAKEADVIPVLYVLLCNIDYLPGIIKYLKESRSLKSFWVSKENPTGFLAKLERAEGISYGFEYTRSDEYRSAFVNLCEGVSAHHAKHCVKWRIMASRTPKGWSKTDLTAFAGNILDPASYSKLAMLLSYEILKYTDLEQVWSETPALSCRDDLIQIAENPMIPNKAWAMIQVMKAFLEFPKDRIVRQAEKIFDSITYIKTIWADEFLNALKHYQTQAKKWDHIIADDTIFKKFTTQFIEEHIDHNGKDPYAQLLHDLAKTWRNKQQGIDRPGTDHEMEQAWNSPSSMLRYLTAAKVRFAAAGHKRLQAPKEWFHTGFATDKKINQEINYQANVPDEVLLVQTQRQRRHNRELATKSQAHEKARSYYYGTMKKHLQVNPVNPKVTFKEHMQRMRNIRNRRQRPWSPSRIGNVPDTNKAYPSVAQAAQLVKEVISVLETQTAASKTRGDNPKLEYVLSKAKRYLSNCNKPNPHSGLESLNILPTGSDDETSQNHEEESFDLLEDEDELLYNSIAENSNSDESLIENLNSMLLFYASDLIPINDQPEPDQMLTFTVHLHSEHLLYSSTEPETDDIQVIVDTGASIGAAARGLHTPIPNGTYKLGEPIIIEQGVKKLRLDEAHLIPQYIKDPNDPLKIYIKMDVVLIAPFDNTKLSIMSSDLAAEGGLGTY